jgi:glucose-1-phosphate adenylyltransferase
VLAYTFHGFWADVGTVQAYWEANMSLLAENPALDLYDPGWVVHTRSQERAPAKVGPNAQVGGNLLSNGCRVDGVVERSLLAPGVYVTEGAVVRDSVILNDVTIEANAIVDRTIVDKKVIIGAKAKVGTGDDNTPNKRMPSVLNTGITLVGKGSVIPAGVEVGRNVVVHSFSSDKGFGRRKKVPSGSNVGEDPR